MKEKIVNRSEGGGTDCILIFDRLLPESGKIHQNQEIYSQIGISPTIKATAYKDHPKIIDNE